MLFILIFALSFGLISFTILTIKWKEILMPALISILWGCLGALLGLLLTLVAIVCFSTTLDSQTYDIATINGLEQQVYYLKENSSYYIIITKENDELITHNRVNYRNIHFIKENEKPYAVKNYLGFKSAFCNKLFKFPDELSNSYTYNFYIPVT